MNGKLKNKLAACALVLIVISFGYIFADDVTVQEGAMVVDNGIQIGNYYNSGWLNVYGNINSYWIGYNSYPYANLSDTWINGDLGTYGDIFVHNEFQLSWTDICNTGYLWAPVVSIDDILFVYEQDSSVVVGGDLLVDGKIFTGYGGIDPPYVLYDQKTRDEIIDQIKIEVPPDKQGGAVMFFNKETKKLETYVASEGKFYDLDGNMIYELAEVVQPTTKYETVYNFNSKTGRVESSLRPLHEKYQIKEGYSLDKKTGKFVNKETGAAAEREEALEIFVASEGKIYDLNHNFVRNVEKTQSPDIAAAGNNDSSGQINTAENNTEKQEITVKPASLN